MPSNAPTTADAVCICKPRSMSGLSELILSKNAVAVDIEQNPVLLVPGVKDVTGHRMMDGRSYSESIHESLRKASFDVERELFAGSCPIHNPAPPPLPWYTVAWREMGLKWDAFRERLAKVIWPYCICDHEDW